jgi:hypothetical protein
MNKWFGGVFLPSIFESVGAGKQKWLSAKQTAICVDNMAVSTVRYDADGYGTMRNHDNYSCEWNGRKVFLWYSKRNGCGCIEFGYNAEEQAALREEADKDRERIKRERIERIKRNPERLTAKIFEIKKKIERAELEYQMDVEDGDEDSAKEDLAYIEELKAELREYD